LQRFEIPLSQNELAGQAFTSYKQLALIISMHLPSTQVASLVHSDSASVLELLQGEPGFLLQMRVTMSHCFSGPQLLLVTHLSPSAILHIKSTGDTSNPSLQTHLFFSHMAAVSEQLPEAQSPETRP
jgi:hypothetical protein